LYSLLDRIFTSERDREGRKSDRRIENISLTRNIILHILRQVGLQFADEIRENFMNGVFETLRINEEFINTIAGKST
jgi:hypothetical protein